MRSLSLLLPMLLLTHSVAWAQPDPAEKTVEAATPAKTAEAPTQAAPNGLNTEPLSIEDSLTLRDPFKKPAKFADPGSDMSIPELERYALDQIKIVGIVTGPKKAKALITTPSNKMFIVQENDKIGVYKGVIRKIKEKSILVREKIVNLVGQEENTDNEIFLNAPAAAPNKGNSPHKSRQ